MISQRRSLGRQSLALLSALIVCLVPAALRAESITLKNLTPTPIVVQASYVFRGQVRQDRPYKLAANDVTPGIRLPGNKVITILDAAAPNRPPLFQGAIPAGTEDLQFNIVLDGTGRDAKMKLEPAKQP